MHIFETNLSMIQLEQMKKNILFVIVIAVLTACGVFNRKDPKMEELPPQEVAAPQPTEIPLNIDGVPMQTDADRVQGKFPGLTLEQLNQGKVLYEANCASCHHLENPSSEPEEEWRSIVPRMVLKANKRSINPITPESEELILRYLIAMGPAQK